MSDDNNKPTYHCEITLPYVLFRTTGQTGKERRKLIDAALESGQLGDVFESPRFDTIMECVADYKQICEEAGLDFPGTARFFVSTDGGKTCTDCDENGKRRCITNASRFDMKKKKNEKRRR